MTVSFEQSKMVRNTHIWLEHLVMIYIFRVSVVERILNNSCAGSIGDNGNLLVSPWESREMPASS